MRLLTSLPTETKTSHCAFCAKRSRTWTTWPREMTRALLASSSLSPRRSTTNDGTDSSSLPLRLRATVTELIDLPGPMSTRSMSPSFPPGRPGRRFIARTVARTPPDFAQANIWIDSRDLSYA